MLTHLRSFCWRTNICGVFWWPSKKRLFPVPSEKGDIFVLQKLTASSDLSFPRWDGTLRTDLLDDATRDIQCVPNHFSVPLILDPCGVMWYGVDSVCLVVRKIDNIQWSKSALSLVRSSTSDLRRSPPHFECWPTKSGSAHQQETTKNRPRVRNRDIFSHFNKQKRRFSQFSHRSSRYSQKRQHVNVNPQSERILSHREKNGSKVNKTKFCFLSFEKECAQQFCATRTDGTNAVRIVN